jgi:DNA uptake protein ComE-like DNA-binding protein
MIFFLALLKGVMQSAEVDEISSTQIQFTSSQPNLVKAKSTSPQVDRASKTLVLINSASAEEIAENLDGIGEAIANRIIAKRQKQGPFKNFSS